MGRGHAGADGGVSLLDVGDAETGNAEDLSGTAVIAGRDGIAFAQRTPADAVDELDLFVESELLDDEIGALVRAKRGVHPRHGLCVGRLIGLVVLRGKGGGAEAEDDG